MRSDRETNIEGGGFAHISGTVFVSVINGDSIKVVACRQIANRNNLIGIVCSSTIFSRRRHIIRTVGDGKAVAFHRHAGDRCFGVSAVGDGNRFRRRNGVCSLCI